MILQDIYFYLKQDKELALLLGAVNKDSKIYPNIAKAMVRPPFLVYRSTNSSGTKEEVLCEEGLNILITASSFEDIVRITEHLHKTFDLIENIPSKKYFIFYVKHTGGTDYYDELGRNVRVLSFIFKFISK